MKVWTVKEIHALPEFGGEVGWFYGLVQDHPDEDEEERIVVAEIFPGMGFSYVDREQFLEDQKSIISDLEKGA